MGKVLEDTRVREAKELNAQDVPGWQTKNEERARRLDDG